MKKLVKSEFNLLRYILFIALACGMVTALAVHAGSQPVYALPEYAARTGEPCAACHISAGGGGPRTLRGMLWAAQGKPDQLPSLPGMLIAPRVTDGLELYGIACSGCHGQKGEGLFAMGLVNTNVSQPAVRSIILNGIPKLGMPSFENQFTPDQLDSLVLYITGLANGTIAPPPDSYPLAPALLRCPPESAEPACKPAPSERKGN